MHRVQILDPSTGTGAFLYQIVDLIRERYRARGDGGLWPGYVRDHLLPRLFGFELLVAPYAVAHLKLGMQLAALDLPADERPTWAYDFKANERLNVYLTNTLDEAEREVMTLWGPLRVIAEEAKTASKIKRDMPIMVILGNPPYSGHSANEGKWINDLLHGDLPGQPGYFEVDGKPLRERNPKWLNDDYVKFIRFAQWRIEHTGQGILAFITNHGYLENPTFRGMRQQLMRTFDEIYVLDLHGNARRRERAPDGSPDENVFDIQQGVAIGMFVKRPRSPDPAPVGWERGDSTAAIDPLSPVERGKGPGIEGGRVHHAELYGAREAKYEWLRGHDIGNTAWQTVNPVTPQYLFVPRAADAQAEYNAGWSIPDIFPVNSVGIVTGQDKKTIAFSRNDAIQLAHGHQLSEKTVVPILYRPFDERYIVYDNSVVTRSRRDVMQHMLAGQNIGLVCTRQQSQQSEWALVGIADKIIEGCYISNKTREINYLLPLYLYPEAGRLMDAPQYPPGKGGRVPNLAPKFVAELAACVGLTFVCDGRGDLQTTFGPEDALHYLYAALHSPEYRERFAPFLKTDFPRVALPTDGSEFVRLRGIGAKLVALHLLDPALDWSGAARFPVKGDNRVERGYPQYKDERVYLNAAQYFAGVAETVWNFQVGGYQVADKWLKDRRGRELTGDELEQYGQIVAALAETARLMGEV